MGEGREQHRTRGFGGPRVLAECHGNAAKVRARRLRDELGGPDTIGGRADERGGATEAHDVYGKRIRLNRDGLTYGKDFLPFDEMIGARPASQPIWNPATNLFEVGVFRRSGADLVIRNLPLRTAVRLGEAITDALRKRQA